MPSQMGCKAFWALINCVYHESSACLLKDGQIIAAVFY